MASIAWQLSSTSQAPHDKIQVLKSSNFAHIPSWVSLKCTPAVKISQNQQGHVENLHLMSLSKQGKLKEACEFLQQMDGAGVSISANSYECLFETCGQSRSLSDGKLLHDRLRRTAKDQVGSLQNSALQMYCDCKSLSDAQKLFDEMLDRKLGSWVIIISAYVEAGLLDKAFGLFSRMLESQIKPNSSTYTGLLKSLVSPSLLEIGKQMHSHVIRTGLNTNASIETAIANMYIKCGCIEGAELVFDRMPDKKSVAWTGLMVGYTQAGRGMDALELFINMVRAGTELDEFVFSIVLKACASLEDLNLGRQVHGFVVKLGLESEVSVGTPLMDFYFKCANFESACRAFERINEPNDVSWSAIISGYCQTGQFEKSVEIFKSLKREDAVLNSFMYTSIFQACAAIADYNMGAQAHADAIKRGLVAFLYGKSAMITMYSKCGRLDYANLAFQSIHEPDTVAWTAIISGHAYHGNASEALRLFRRMQDCGVRPNAVTFIAILTACSHSGLVTEAKHYLDSMRAEYGVDPTIDHYNCMVDAYARAGLIEEALELVKRMPFDADAMSWKCLLGGCLTHQKLELGKLAADKLLHLDPEDTAAYILLFNLYASSGNWEEAAHVRRMMAERNLKKELSCSWITVKGKRHRFTVGDKHHPRSKEIYSKLKEFDHSGRNDEAALLTEEDVSRNLGGQKEQLLDHSERLAIAFGLISMPTSGTIVIFKNLRACKDCHDFAKQVSLVTEREVVIRDSSRFHHFQLGQCSCNDYW